MSDPTLKTIISWLKLNMALHCTTLLLIARKLGNFLFSIGNWQSCGNMQLHLNYILCLPCDAMHTHEMMVLHRFLILTLYQGLQLTTRKRFLLIYQSLVHTLGWFVHCWLREIPRLYLGVTAIIQLLTNVLMTTLWSHWCVRTLCAQHQLHCSTSENTVPARVTGPVHRVQVTRARQDWPGLWFPRQCVSVFLTVCVTYKLWYNISTICPFVKLLCIIQDYTTVYKQSLLTLNYSAYEISYKNVNQACLTLHSIM